MFSLEIETEFCAAHAIVIGGVRERLHGHTFRVTAVVGGQRLDSDGLLVDFHAVERWLADIVGPFRDANLNEVEPFDRWNPTAERIAQFIGDALQVRLPSGVRIESVRLTEAPGCAAVYRPGPDRP